MDIVSATGVVRDMLEVDLVRYPQAVRVLHVNEAMSHLSREYEVRMNEFSGTMGWGAGVGDKDIPSDFVDLDLNTETITSLFYNPATLNVELLEGDLTEVLRKYGDTTGVPTVFAQYGRKLYVRPVPTEDFTLRYLAVGWPRSILSGENEWLRIAQYPVIYRALEIASLWLTEDQRIPQFRNLRMESMEMVNIADSARNDGPRESQEA